MADRRAARQQKAKAKKKLKRAKKRRAGNNPSQVGQQGPSLNKAVNWPIGPCFINTSWTEQGADLLIVMSRTHADGTTVAVRFSGDLAGNGVQEEQTSWFRDPQSASSLCVDWTEAHKESVVEVGPELCAHAIVEANRYQHQQPGAPLSNFELLFSSVAPTSPELTVSVGPKAVVPEQKRGWLDRLFGG